jgi:PBP1b-binding outer membrane lipoprotein LpoB
MKKITAFFILVILLSFVSCDTVTHYTMKVSVDKNPALIIENRTGYPVVVTAPVPSNINVGATAQIQPAETRGTITVSYMIGRVPFTEQVTMNNADVTVALTKRPPTLTVVNRTGYPLELITPERLSIDQGGSNNFMATPNQINNITYRIGRMQITEQATVANQDVTVNLTKRPATITIVNNVGSTINMIWMRTSGTQVFSGGNIIERKDGTLLLRDTTAAADEMSGSIINRDSRKLWLGDVDVNLTGNTFDIRLTDVQRNEYIKRNVQVTSDITLTFTAADR